MPMSFALSGARSEIPRKRIDSALETNCETKAATYKQPYAVIRP
jgi:hypothetical protein